MPEKTLLELRNIGFIADDHKILDDVSLTLNRGELCIITGPSGCGKSTLLKIAATLLEPTSGTVILSGAESQTLKPEEYRKRVSYCFQTPLLFGSTVMDNLAFPYLIRGQRADEEKIRQGLRRLHLDAGIVYKPIDELSGGEKQRVALLRNLQYLPEVLLLDEVTSALDDDNKQIVHQLIDELVQEHQLGVLWISHNSDEIHSASHVFHMQPVAAEAAHE